MIFSIIARGGLTWPFCKLNAIEIEACVFKIGYLVFGWWILIFESLFEIYFLRLGSHAISVAISKLHLTCVIARKKGGEVKKKKRDSGLPSRGRKEGRRKEEEEESTMCHSAASLPFRAWHVEFVARCLSRTSQMCWALTLSSLIKYNQLNIKQVNTNNQFIYRDLIFSWFVFIHPFTPFNLFIFNLWYLREKHPNLFVSKWRRLP